MSYRDPLSYGEMEKPSYGEPDKQEAEKAEKNNEHQPPAQMTKESPDEESEIIQLPEKDLLSPRGLFSLHKTTLPEKIPASVAAKLTRAAAKIQVVETGHDASTRSDYMSNADIMRACNPVLDEVGLAIVYLGSDILGSHRTDPSANGVAGVETFLESHFAIVDTESGDQYQISVIGSGRHYGGKSHNIAYTMAVNYAFRMILNLTATPKNARKASTQKEPQTTRPAEIDI